jgi:hypothetical protein
MSGFTPPWSTPNNDLDPMNRQERVKRRNDQLEAIAVALTEYEHDDWGAVKDAMIGCNLRSVGGEPTGYMVIVVKFENTGDRALRMDPYFPISTDPKECASLVISDIKSKPNPPNQNPS